MKLIVNADDFGYSKGVNKGIEDAFSNGVLTSTTLMVTGSDVGGALEIMERIPNLGVGLHFNVTLGKPLTKCTSLLSKEGDFIKPKFSPNQALFSEEEIYNELKAQFDLFLKLTGKTPTHIDSHLYAHQTFEKVKRVVISFAREVNLPLRDEKINEYKKASFYNFFKCYNEDNEVLIEEVITDMHGMLKKEKCELMCHPAYIDDYLMENSSYNKQRLRELCVLKDERIISFVKENGIELVDFLGNHKER